MGATENDQYMIGVWLEHPDIGPEEDPHVVLELETTLDGEPYILSFLVGGIEKQLDHMVEPRESEDGRASFSILSDDIEAVGYYLGLCETVGLSEDFVHEELEAAMEAANAREIYAEYLEWCSDLSPRDRRLRLLEQAETDTEHEVIGTDMYVDVLESGSWRETGLSSGAERVAKQLRSRITVQPRKCYKTAQRAVHAYDGGRDVQYVEGIALNKHGVRITGHAWVEIDGKVAELTWPWHAVNPPEETQYFGVPVPIEDVPSPGDREFSRPVVIRAGEGLRTH